jgi:glyoxylase I family protein
MFKALHHIAIICSDYQRSKAFYVEKLGFKVISEVYRQERDSFKLELGLNEKYVIELFSFPNPPARTTRPEASGLRHLAFEVVDVAYTKAELEKKGIACEAIRVDEYTHKKFTFFEDPDHLPLEIYET